MTNQNFDGTAIRVFIAPTSAFNTFCKNVGGTNKFAEKLSAQEKTRVTLHNDRDLLQQPPHALIKATQVKTAESKTPAVFLNVADQDGQPVFTAQEHNTPSGAGAYVIQAAHKVLQNRP